jgi:hypothetical protein
MGATKLMPNLFRKLLSQNRAGPLRTLLFFLLFYLYLWLRVDLRLIYHSGQTITNFPAFFRTWDFFRHLAPYPGGLVEYLSAFLSQFFYIGWAGALVVTLQAALICLCTDYFLKLIKASHLRCLRFVPPVLVLITYTMYTYQFVTTTAFLMALIFVCLYLKVAPDSQIHRLLVFLLLSVILYTMAGGAYLLFALLCAIYELLSNRRWQMALTYLFSAAVTTFLLGVLIFGVSTNEAFTDLLPFSIKILSQQTRRRMTEALYVLYLLLPLTALLLGLWRLSAGEKAKRRPRRKPSKLRSSIVSWYTSAPVLKWSLESALLLVFAGTAVFFFRDYKLKTILQADYYAYHKMWPQVLAAYRRHPNSFFIVHAVNRALYHTGRLPYDMFAYNQHPNTLFLTSVEHQPAWWKKADVFIDLGVMNMGEGALVESTERLGERPNILKRLALIAMVKQDINTARVYLGALTKTPFHADWADNYLKLLDSGADPSTDKHIRHLTSLTVENDYGFTGFRPERILLDLLDKNRYNHMAFEYLMAWYLLTSQLDSFVQNLHRLDDFDYPQIPPLYEQAILVYEVLTGTKVDLKDRQISPQTYDLARRFSDISTSEDATDRLTAMRLALRDFGDSYLFYFNFGDLGIAK